MAAQLASTSAATASPSRLRHTLAKTDLSPASGPPLDYSFQELTQVNDLLFERPVSGIPRRAALQRDSVHIPEYLESCANDDSRPPGNREFKFNSTAVRVCNNSLVSLANLDRVLHHVLDDPLEMVWLDASCNQLASIEDVVLRFPKLQVLYLHGNQIRNLHDVLKLSKLEHLQKLTLHGNPVSEMRNYKLWVCAHLPGLRSLDFSTITRVDRDKTQTWWKSQGQARS